MYARQIKGHELSFGVSGKLIEDSLVMYDRQTGSLWPQVDGKAIEGPLSGHRLMPLVSFLMTWKEWKTLYPETLVLKTDKDPSGSAYAEYYRSRGEIGMGYASVSDDRLWGKNKVLGIQLAGRSMVFPLKELEKKKLAQARIGPLPVVVIYAENGDTAVAFTATAPDGVELTFQVGEPRDGAQTIVDDDSHSTWNALSGEAVDGPRKGERLTPIGGMVAYWYAWQNFFTGSEIWNENEQQ